MADFVEEEDTPNQKVAGGEEQESAEVQSAPTMIDYDSPVLITYCPTCTMPPEFCEYGSSFDKCLPWIMENCQEALSEAVLAKMLGNASLEDGVSDSL